MRIVLYTREGSLFGDKIRTLLNDMEIKFKEYKLEDFESEKDFKRKVGTQYKTLPQVKLEGRLIGGYKELVESFVEKGLMKYN
jgi:glutaredoxin